MIEPVKPVDLEAIRARIKAIEPYGLADEWAAEIWEENEPQAPDCWIVYGVDKSPEASIANVCGGNQDPESVSKFIAHSRQDIPALCDEVEALRERVKEMEEIGDHYQFKWATLKDWLIRDKENGSGHKVSRALFLIAELENQPKEIESNG